MISLVEIGLIVGLSLVISYAGVAGLRRWALHRQMLDIPNERSSHSLPTPRGGGAVIALVVLGGGLAGWIGAPTWSGYSFAAFAVCAAGLACVGWWDDLHTLPARTRFAIQGVAALVLVLACGGWAIVALPRVGMIGAGWLGALLAILWIVGLTNAYNFMDGVDGLAGTQAVVAGVGWVILGYIIDERMIVLLGALLAGASLGFLGHNWSPARIFMGDVGSTFLGFTFAALAVIGAQDTPRLVVAGALLVWPFVFDTLFTVVRRGQRGENVLAAHRSHLYQRLTIAGWSHRQVTLLYGALGTSGGLVAVLWLVDAPGAEWAVLLLIPLLALSLWRLVIHVEDGRDARVRVGG